MEIIKISQRNIVFKFALTGWNLNMHLIIGEKNNYLIDTGLGFECANEVKKYLEYTDNNKNPLIIINTHYHWDHIWGNHCFLENTTISHKLCRDMIIDNWDDMKEKSGQYILGETKMHIPTLVFSDEIYFPNDKIKLFYTPGHTIDSISVFDEVDSIINVGDNIGDSDEYIIPSLAVEKSLYKKTIEKYKEYNIKHCVSGHNGIMENSVFDKILDSMRNNHV